MRLPKPGGDIASDETNVKSAQPARVSLRARLFEPVDIGFLVSFRILLGALLLWEVCLFFQYGLVERYFVEPPFHFTYLGFGWVKPWPPAGMTLHFILLGICATFILAGFAYRPAVALFCLGFTYVFLLEKARYMNHFYLIILICGLLILMPAHGRWAMDAWLRPAIHRSHVPTWILWLLRFQFGVVYFFSGLAKLHPDWLSGRVMEQMLAYKTEIPFVASLATNESAILFISYGALLFDLGIVPLLLWRPLRVPAMLLMLIFHTCNVVLFNIDIFPYLMIGATVILFAPEWFSFGRLKSKARHTSLATDKKGSLQTGSKTRQRVTIVLLGIYVTLQILIPLRHYAYPGDTSWSDEGQSFAWRMLMRVKRGETPQFPVRYMLRGRAYQGTVPQPADPHAWQDHWQASKILLDPDMILQFVKMRADELRNLGATNIDIRAIVPVSLNGRPSQLLIDPGVNLDEVKRSLWPKTWVTEFQSRSPEEPLP